MERDEAGVAQAREELQHHFAWVPDLARRIAEYEAHRKDFSSYESFMSVVASFFDAHAATLPDPGAKVPRLVRGAPANGASEVSPDLAEMDFEFDRPMRDASWSSVGSPRDQPEVVGKLAYDASRRRLTLPVRLEPGRSCRFWLDNER